jgi:hypothetical protein
MEAICDQHVKIYGARGLTVVPDLPSPLFKCGYFMHGVCSWRFWSGVRHFWQFLLFLAKLTPAMPNLVEFFGEKRRNQFLPYLLLGKTFLHVFLVDFGSLRPSGAIGAGFRAIGGHLQVIFLQGSFQGH